MSCSDYFVKVSYIQANVEALSCLHSQTFVFQNLTRFAISHYSPIPPCDRGISQFSLNKDAAQEADI